MSWLSKLSGKSKGAAAATVAKERPSQPPRIIIDRHDYTPEEFAVGSFRIRPYDGDLIAKQQFDFKISFDLDGDAVEFVCRGIVVKMDEQVGLVARYQQPQPFYERKLLEYLKRWKGL
ncbi:hypothetical protein [Azospirillum sp.]|uniref:hypothetical protein n=1 Tax=Azospirillum sp. TaxID=34012 RepID=UPI002D281906|nr:hypothetical protein [Azospirillum sp.]HYD69345.1 hypothetical protein [Azospirillum sp.]